MNVWLVTVGEPLPTDAGTPRLLRAGIIAQLLRDRGHQVVWWSSSFDHQSKTQRCDGYQQRRLPSGAMLHLLPGRPYRSTVSLARIGNHRDNAREFALAARAQVDRPDVLLCSYPTLELCEEAIDFGREQGIPVVVDVRDLWPDIFGEVLPRFFAPLLSLALTGMYRQSVRVMRGASAIIGITDDFVQWGLKRGSRSPGPFDRSYAMAYVEKPPAPEALAHAQTKWRELGVREQDLNFVFFGTVGRQFDISTVISAARQTRDPRVRFILCGTGDRLDDYKAQASDTKNVIFPGWVDAPMIRTLMQMAQAGLAPYKLSDNFNSNIPNKIVEYLAGGLPVITTLTGIPGRMLADHGCGLSYAHGDAGALAAAVDMLCADRPRQAAMASAAAAVYRQRFDAEVVYGSLIADLQQLVDQQQSPKSAAHDVRLPA